jgi:cytoskeleton protein RodZ
MNEPLVDQPSGEASAGAMLRAARERCGMHIGLLSTTLKVPVRKLELLESNQFDELHDATFVRALALSVCRVLKCDPAPILEALPRLDAHTSTLDQVSQGGSESSSQLGSAPVVLRSATDRRGWWWAVTLLMLLAVALWWAPASWMSWRTVAPGAAGCGSVSRSAAFWSGCIRSLTVSVVFVDWSGGPDGSWGPRRVGGQFHCGHGLGRQRHGALLGRGH